MKNSIKSIQDKLKNHSKTKDKVHHYTLVRYFQERLLYRLFASEFRNNFLLKGGALIYFLNQDASRYTVDIDFLAKNVSVTDSHIKSIFTQICGIELDDGVYFEVEKITIAEIIKEGKYKGTRIKIPSKLGNIKHLLQIDIGVGDIVTPRPMQIEYPVLLHSEPILLFAYSVETLIAEKFQAMIVLKEKNSRMKDFYDLYTILSVEGKYNPTILKEAIQNTFAKRKTGFFENHILFQDNFYQNERRLIQWKAFLRKSHLDQSIEFASVMKIIKGKLLPIYEALQD